MNDAATALTDRADIVTGIPVSSGRHSGCRPRFGPDGNLAGDRRRRHCDRSAEPDITGRQGAAGDTNGRAVAGNAPAPFDPRIYNYGHRNVQGIAFSPGGKAFSIEHGTGGTTRSTGLYAGANYGWDPRPLSGAVFYDESRPMTDLVRYPGRCQRRGRPAARPSLRPAAPSLSGPRWKGWDGAWRWRC